MLFNRPVHEVEYSDIEALTSSGERESVSLDYKREIVGSDGDKAELAKDISAMANSQGGYLVIGVDETEGRPVHPPCGTNVMLGRQKTEEWIEQTINANIAQRVNTEIKSVPTPEKDKCIVVIHIPVSKRMPHMVIFRQDNRYYRRIFKRHQFQSLPAEEYEIREMFEKGARLHNRVLDFLSAQGYGDRESDGFAMNRFTASLGMSESNPPGQRKVIAAQSFVTFVAIPEIMEEDLLDVSSDRLWGWVDPNLRRYEPADGLIFLPLNKRMTLDGILLTGDRLWAGGEQTNRLDRFVRILRNGFVEMGWASAQKEGQEVFFPFASMIGYVWLFMEFVQDLYTETAVHSPIVVMLNMKGTEDALLHDLGDGWVEPYSQDVIDGYRPRCLDRNVQIFRAVGVPGRIHERIQVTLREFATIVENAWGERKPRCYNSPERDPEERLNLSKLRYWF